MNTCTAVSYTHLDVYKRQVLPESIVYFRTYFAGSMGVVMYNIFVGVLQSVGDGRHPRCV